MPVKAIPSHHVFPGVILIRHSNEAFRSDLSNLGSCRNNYVGVICPVSGQHGEGQNIRNISGHH